MWKRTVNDNNNAMAQVQTIIARKKLTVLQNRKKDKDDAFHDKR